MDTVTIGIELGALTSAPVYENHKRGRNWLAAVVKDPKSPGGLRRSFQESAKGDYYYIIDGLKPLDVIEFGADYFKASGRKDATRWYGVVLSISDTELVVAHEPNMTAAKAFQLAAEMKAAPVSEKTAWKNMIDMMTVDLNAALTTPAGTSDVLAHLKDAYGHLIRAIEAVEGELMIEEMES